MFSKEANLLQEFAESRKAIRQKHLQLRHGIQETEHGINQVFKPIIEPLNKIVKDSKKDKNVIQVLPNDSKIIKHHSTPFKKNRFQ